ncbi:Cyclic nucleotide-binding domain protein [Candidatus Coxiella mudrowiae]|uniref:Cyclic nucleotide-binding domain protein n=1 Tax=Candidatus Coxiella mudrowiae TaxID=2054173 RepID=A0ABM5UUI5_9COXI|nr:Cyclic nucleotide-binding domain protein [Candidatus Coxiella mudrowiae]
MRDVKAYGFTRRYAIFRKRQSESFYIIVSGSVSIRKIYKATGHIYEVSILSTNNTIGEMVLIEDKPRSTLMVSLIDSKLIEIPMEPIKKNVQILSLISQNISHILSERLRKINEVIVKSIQNELDELKKRNDFKSAKRKN